MSENLYYHPEKYGLTDIGEHDCSDSYYFNKLVLWADNDGKRYAGADSGCSCPSPFEDITSVEQLTRVYNKTDFVDFAVEHHNCPGGNEWVDGKYGLTEQGRLRVANEAEQIWEDAK